MNQKRNNDELLTTVFGSKEVLEPAPTDVIPQGMMRPEIAYQIVKDETYPQTQPRLNLATFVTTYMDEYATRLMNEAISVNYIDETEYPRIAVMNGRCINMIANLWNTPEKAQWKAGALGIGPGLGMDGQPLQRIQFRRPGRHVPPPPRTTRTSRPVQRLFGVVSQQDRRLDRVSHLHAPQQTADSGRALNSSCGLRQAAMHGKSATPEPKGAVLPECGQPETAAGPGT